MNKETKLPLPIHIGMHKTASTYLQTLILPKFFPEAPVSSKGLLINSGYEYNSIRRSIADQLQAVNPKAAEVMRKDDPLSLENIPSIVLSSESWSGRQKANYPGESWERFNTFITSLNNIDRIPKIIMFCRPHEEWLKSAFLHQHRNGSSRTFLQFLNGFDNNDLNWTMRAKALQSFDFRIYSYSDLRERPLAVINDICEFWNLTPIADIPSSYVNYAPKTLMTLKMQRYINRVIRVSNNLPILNIPPKLRNIISDTNSFKYLDRLFKACNFRTTHQMNGLEIPKKNANSYSADWASLEPFIQKL